MAGSFRGEAIADILILNYINEVYDNIFIWCADDMMYRQVLGFGAVVANLIMVKIKYQS